MSPFRRILFAGALVAFGGAMQIIAGWPIWIPAGVFVVYLILAGYLIHLRKENDRAA